MGHVGLHPMPIFNWGKFTPLVGGTMRTEKQERRLKRLLKKPLREGYKRKCHGCGKQFKSINGHARHKQFHCYWRPERVEEDRIADEKWEAEFLAKQKALQQVDKAIDFDPMADQEGIEIGGLVLTKFSSPDAGGSFYRWVRKDKYLTIQKETIQKEHAKASAVESRYERVRNKLRGWFKWT